MNKIEDKLTMCEPADAMLLISAVDKFYLEANMLFNNIYLSQTIFNLNPKNKIFPLDYDYYDASWYKNLLISADILIDRFHYEIDENKDYAKVFENTNNCNFLAFAKKWNLINYIVKFNLDENAWKEKCAGWKISQTTIWLEELIKMNIKFDQTKFNDVSLKNELYEPLADAIGRNGFQAILDYILENDELQKKAAEAARAKERPAPINPMPVNASPFVEHSDEDEPDPRSPAGVDKEMTKLMEWVLLKQTTIRAKNAAGRPELKEISPVRKVMIELLEWIDHKEVLAAAWANTKKYGFDPFEYKDIVDDLAYIKNLRAQLDADVEGCVEFANNNDPETRFKPTKQVSRKYFKAIKMATDPINLVHDKELIKRLEKLAKELKATNNQTRAEIKEIDKEIEALLAYLPFDERVECQQEINEMKASFKVNENASIDDLVEAKIDDINEEIEKIDEVLDPEGPKHKARPISKVKDEMDVILAWISSLCENCAKEFKKYGYVAEKKGNNNYVIKPINGTNPLEAKITPKKEEPKEPTKEPKVKETKKPEPKKEVKKEPKKEVKKELKKEEVVTPVVETIVEPQVVYVEAPAENLPLPKSKSPKVIKLKIQNRDYMNGLEKLIEDEEIMSKAARKAARKLAAEQREAAKLAALSPTPVEEKKPNVVAAEPKKVVATPKPAVKNTTPSNNDDVTRKPRTPASKLFNLIARIEKLEANNENIPHAKTALVVTKKNSTTSKPTPVKAKTPVKTNNNKKTKPLPMPAKTAQKVSQKR